ncbi:MAG: hypothetical protein Q8878_05715, partial [Bacillota bacterium]|nr:hypothetical protein [Bacillota bacterium]
VSFRYDTDINPVVFRTEDKGITWTKFSLEIPESFKSVTTYATALSPVFNGAKGILPVTFRNNSWKGDPVDVTVRYETSDYGKTWTFNDKSNLALVWADARSTRDGRARFGIMSQKMQAEFRAQQSSPDNYVVRWSSPWVVSCDVSLDGDQAVVTYLYTDSTTAAYKGVERLSFGTESGRTVIAGCRTETDMEEYVDTSGWKPVDTGLYKFRIPKEWEASVFEDGSVCLSFSSNGDELGRIEILDYDPSLTVSQFEGNHAETLSREDLPGCKYPAARVVIRRTKPAAANDNSYVGEQHVYLIPKNSGYAVDLSFDSPYVNKKASEIAKSLVLDIDRLKIQNAARQWAEAVKTRDGKAQYDLMSPKLQKSRFADYQEQNWVTGQSSPWVDGYRITPGDKTAGVVYTYMTSEGFAGYYFQTLSFVTENGQPKISGFTDPAQANGNSSGIVVAYLDEKDTWLSAARSNGGMFSDMTLSVNGKTKRFPWKTYSEPAFLPELSYADVDGDGKSELVAILCEGEGTGVNQEEIHVINPENFSEITVQSPIRALSDHAVSKIDKNGVSITIDSQNPIILSEKEIEAKVADKKSWFSDLETGSIIDYSVDGNNIVARVAAQLSPAGFLGDFKIKYKYSDHRLNAGDVSFSQDM